MISRYDFTCPYQPQPPLHQMPLDMHVKGSYQGNVEAAVASVYLPERWAEMGFDVVRAHVCSV